MPFSKYILFTTVLLLILPACAQKQNPVLTEYSEIIPGDSRLDSYLPLIEGKRTGIVANQSSVIGNTHLADTLIGRGIELVKIFCPEHGFRGTEDAGAVISASVDEKTGIPIISLYGKHKKPTPDDLKDIDIMVFDLQDVGTRFYTYISTLAYVMEACAEQDIPLIVLDRPNPNGFYVDGPVLKKEYRSFVGMHEIPVVYGMTIGEYAQMVNGERWLKDSATCDLTVIPMEKYTHNMIVKLPVRPSPNLPNWKAIYLYPSLCFFESTIVSVGRGTEFPFQVFGHPDYPEKDFYFVPRSLPGATNPKLKGDTCYGRNLTTYAENYAANQAGINLNWLTDTYKKLGNRDNFFTGYFDKLAGSDQLRKQILSGMTEKEIKATWAKDLETFKEIRKKYLIYP